MADPGKLHPPLREWVSRHVATEYKEVLRLTVQESKNDPPQEPFKSLYAARESLNTLKARLELLCPEALKEHEDFTVLAACLQLELGLNHVNTEEPGRGEGLLEECLSRLGGLPSKVKTASVSIQALNQLGILWGNRDEQQKALECLLKSKAVYESHVALPPPITDSEWLLAKEEEEEETRERAFESHHTLTLFYLAQVYGNLKQPKQSAQYCQNTLSRQLEASGTGTGGGGDFDPIEWSLNAATLSQYYLTQDNYAQARHCLAAASCVLHRFEREEARGGGSTSAATGEGLPLDPRMEERLGQTKADISRCWTKYCLSLLASSEQQQQQQAAAGAKKPRNKLFRFDELDVSDLEASVPGDLVSDYEQAKQVFLVCQEHVAASKRHYTLEEHASESVCVVQDHSSAFRLLACFEASDELKCRMHKRRVDMLSALRGELNQRHYLGEHRQLAFETGETLSEMAGLKIVSASQSPSVHAVSKINKLLRSAVRAFEEFLATFHDQATGSLPSVLDADYLRPILCSKLNIGRLYSKLVAPDPPTQRCYLEQSLEEYKWLVGYCERHREEAEKVFAEELSICKEMVELLPLRIAKVA